MDDWLESDIEQVQHRAKAVSCEAFNASHPRDALGIDASHRNGISRGVFSRHE